MPIKKIFLKTTSQSWVIELGSSLKTVELKMRKWFGNNTREQLTENPKCHTNMLPGLLFLIQIMVILVDKVIQHQVSRKRQYKFLLHDCCFQATDNFVFTITEGRHLSSSNWTIGKKTPQMTLDAFFCSELKFSQLEAFRVHLQIRKALRALKMGGAPGAKDALCLIGASVVLVLFCGFQLLFRFGLRVTAFTPHVIQYFNMKILINAAIMENLGEWVKKHDKCSVLHDNQLIKSQCTKMNARLKGWVFHIFNKCVCVYTPREWYRPELDPHSWWLHSAVGAL